ncbi:unnamed protein product [Malus baccata var. baccata]
MDTSNSTGQIESAAPLPLASPGVDCQATQLADQTKEEPTKGIDLDVFNAAKQGNVDALREHGEHLDIKLTATKNTVLHIYIACSSSPTFNESEKQVLESTNIVEDILKTCPALLLQQNESGETALHIAARHGRAGIVGALIRAAKARHDDLEKGVLSEEAWKMLIRATNNGKDTALHEAVRFNHFAVVEILTREDPECLYTANGDGETPIYMAVERGYCDLVYKMMKTCKNPVYKGPNGRTALHAAVTINGIEMTKDLLKYTEKALTKEVDEKGWTPLHYAASMGHTSIVKSLLAADKSAAYIGDNEKVTPLHVAALGGHAEVMKELIACCPDCCELVDRRRRNALHFCIKKRHHQVEQLVRQDPWLSNVLLNGKDEDGNTPLHLMAYAWYNNAGFIRDARVDKMTFNKENLNALNIVQALPYSEQQIYLQSTLKEIGAIPGHRISSDKDGGSSKVEENIGGSQVEKNRGVGIEVKEGRDSHLVVATLIATVTFAAGFTMPGGYQGEKGPDQGFAVLSRNAAFKAFVITNTIAMAMSSCSVMVLLFCRNYTSLTGKLQKNFHNALSFTLFALMAMVVAFITGTYVVLSGRSPGLAVATCVLGCLFFFALAKSMNIPVVKILVLDVPRIMFRHKFPRSFVFKYMRCILPWDYPRHTFNAI